MASRQNIKAPKHPPGQRQATILGDPTLRNGAEPIITVYVAPGTSNSIRPEDVIRAEGETDEAYAERQALTVELWSIPDCMDEAPS
jgi:hypothetical protein